MSDGSPESEALLKQPYGIFLVGSRDGDEMNLMTANWGTQVSFEPRLYAILIERDAHTRKLIDAGGAFSISYLPSDSEHVVSFYTKPAEVVGNKLGEHAFIEAPQTKVPVLEEAVAWFECRVTQTHEIGDHIQYVGEVVGGAVNSDAPAWTLQELGWDYGG
ncbi:MAG: flavin reductase [Dehalococcoidia bacterium]|nr:flavin reductase [Dehalococcoidia bacterium]